MQQPPTLMARIRAWLHKHAPRLGVFADWLERGHNLWQFGMSALLLVSSALGTIATIFFGWLNWYTGRFALNLRWFSDSYLPMSSVLLIYLALSTLCSVILMRTVVLWKQRSSLLREKDAATADLAQNRLRIEDMQKEAKRSELQQALEANLRTLIDFIMAAANTAPDDHQTRSNCIGTLAMAFHHDIVGESPPEEKKVDFFRYDPQTRTFSRTVSVPAKREGLESHHTLTLQSLAGRALLSHKRLYVADTLSPRARHIGYVDIGNATKYRSIAVEIVWIDARPIGVLTMNGAKPNQFSAHDLYILERYAQLFALAYSVLPNARSISG